MVVLADADLDRAAAAASFGAPSSTRDRSVCRPSGSWSTGRWPTRSRTSSRSARRPSLSATRASRPPRSGRSSTRTPSSACGGWSKMRWPRAPRCYRAASRANRAFRGARGVHRAALDYRSGAAAELPHLACAPRSGSSRPARPGSPWRSRCGGRDRVGGAGEAQPRVRRRSGCGGGLLELDTVDPSRRDKWRPARWEDMFTSFPDGRCRPGPGVRHRWRRVGSLMTAPRLGGEGSSASILARHDRSGAPEAAVDHLALRGSPVAATPGSGPGDGGSNPPPAAAPYLLLLAAGLWVGFRSPPGPSRRRRARRCGPEDRSGRRSAAGRARDRRSVRSTTPRRAGRPGGRRP